MVALLHTIAAAQVESGGMTRLDGIPSHAIRISCIERVLCAEVNPQRERPERERERERERESEKH